MNLNAMAQSRTRLARQAALVLAGTAVLALASQIAVPFYPLPMTLQTAAVLAIGLTFGARLGAITVLAWLAEGALGLPVFANFSATASLAGPTAGFLAGFVGMAFLAGLATDRGVTGPIALSVVTLGISALLYIPGLLWPLGLAQVAGIEAGWAGLAFGDAVSTFAAPYLLGDAVKAVLVAMIVAGAASALRKTR